MSVFGFIEIIDKPANDSLQFLVFSLCKMCKILISCFNYSKKKLRAMYGKWVEALYSYDVEVWESFIKKSGKTMDSLAQAALTPNPRVSITMITVILKLLNIIHRPIIHIIQNEGIN